MAGNTAGSLGMLERLPLELRHMIYAEFTHQTVHICYSKKHEPLQLVYKNCRAQPETADHSFWGACVACATDAQNYSEYRSLKEVKRWYSSTKEGSLEHDDTSRVRSNPLHDLLSLYLSSRQVYTEAEPIFWAESTIVLSWLHLDPFTRRFLRSYPRVHNLKRPRSSLIRRIHLVLPTRFDYGSASPCYPYAMSPPLTALSQMRDWKQLRTLSLTLTPRRGLSIDPIFDLSDFTKNLSPCLQQLQDLKVQYYIDLEEMEAFSLLDHDPLSDNNGKMIGRRLGAAWRTIEDLKQEVAKDQSTIEST